MKRMAERIAAVEPPSEAIPFGEVVLSYFDYIGAARADNSVFSGIAVLGS